MSLANMVADRSYQSMFCFLYTVKFLIVANRSRPPNFQKITIFLQKVSYLENLQLKPHDDFWDLSTTKTIFISYKKGQCPGVYQDAGH